MNTVNDSEFATEIEEGSKNQVVVVNFTASWCGPCRAMKPRIEELATEYPDTKFVQVDVDEASENTVRLGIMGVPTYIVYSQGVEKLRVTGSGPTIVNSIKESIDNLKAPA